MLIAAGVASFVVALLGTWALLTPFGRFALDQPNERSLHERPVPRTGGIAVLAGGAISLAFGVSPLWLAVLLAFGLAAVSLLDDLYGMPVTVRLVAHLTAAGVIVWYTLSPMHAGTMLFLALGIAWSTNIYNFMDGSDGLAGGMSVVGFGTYAVAAHIGGDVPLATFCLALAGGAAAFLVYNFHPARIFLGDVGSIPLGFLAAGLGLAGWRDDLWPLWFPVLVFAPFIGDATITLLKRILRGYRAWEPHRDHYYQRMVRMGLGHRRTACVEYVLMILCAGAALYGRNKTMAAQAAVLLGATVMLTVLAIWVEVRWSRFLRTLPKAA